MIGKSQPFREFSVSYTADDLNWVYIREDSQIKVIKTEKKGDWLLFLARNTGRQR